TVRSLQVTGSSWVVILLGTASTYQFELQSMNGDQPGGYSNIAQVYILASVNWPNMNILSIRGYTNWHNNPDGLPPSLYQDANAIIGASRSPDGATIFIDQWWNTN